MKLLILFLICIIGLSSSIAVSKENLKSNEIALSNNINVSNCELSLRHVTNENGEKKYGLACIQDKKVKSWLIEPTYIDGYWVYYSERILRLFDKIDRHWYLFVVDNEGKVQKYSINRLKTPRYANSLDEGIPTVYAIQRDGKWAIVYGNEITDHFEYDDYRFLSENSFYCGCSKKQIYVAVKKNDKWHLIIAKAGYVGPVPNFDYEEIKIITGKDGAFDYIAAKKNGKWDVFIVYQGTLYQASDFEYDEQGEKINSFLKLESDTIYINTSISLKSDLAKKKNGKWAICNEDLNIITDFIYDDIVSLKRGYALKQKDKYAWYDGVFREFETEYIYTIEDVEEFIRIGSLDRYEGYRNEEEFTFYLKVLYPSRVLTQAQKDFIYKRIGDANVSGSSKKMMQIVINTLNDLKITNKFETIMKEFDKHDISVEHHGKLQAYGHDPMDLLASLFPGYYIRKCWGHGYKNWGQYLNK